MADWAVAQGRLIHHLSPLLAFTRLCIGPLWAHALSYQNYFHNYFILLHSLQLQISYFFANNVQKCKKKVNFFYVEKNL